ncbi:MAG: hypothetical protein PHN46_09855 [Eubacteriales bacterium]|nr:hypothetical protein [Eubacteriales bacterium]
MKKNLMIFTLALLIAMPVFGLAADATTPVAPEIQVTETAPIVPLDGQYGRRWNQVAPDTTVPAASFVDADGDGVCDNCGNALGTNPDAPNHIDENKDGVCDHLGTDEQGQGHMQAAQGRGQDMRGHHQQAQGLRVQGNAQGKDYADANNDGVCDNLGSNGQKAFGRGGNRR